VLDPGFFAGFGFRRQLLFDRFRDEPTERNAAVRRNGFRAAKTRVRNFQSSLPEVILPYLWDPANPGTVRHAGAAAD
jgi:hypothetical protein